MFSLRLFVFHLFTMCVVSQLQSGDFVSREEVETLKSRIQSLETQLKAKQDRTPLISFRAGFSHDPAPLKYNNGQNVIFDKMYLNDGNAYSPRSGMFRAPVSGLYLFTLHVLPSSSEMEFRIVKEGSAIAYVVATHSGGTESIQTAIHLHKNQEVWVVKVYGGDTLRGSLLSTFSGFLLRTDDGNFHSSSVVG
ncbi:complement C1q-like protein 4 [Gigantopelta aegis]|uniref:complement C1q-like protein 4 n=1 Tax=Gigantopelta aegis TaxID=1735272 RepID=UPI001B88E34A|nr:complement C1q-like protein 4 [Gigantopelta aegis]